MRFLPFFLVFLLVGCTAPAPAPPSSLLEEPAQEASLLPHIYEMRLVREDIRSHIGSGTIVNFKLRPSEFMIRPGETVQFTSIGPLNEKIRIVSYSKTDTVSKFTEVYSGFVHQGESFFYVFTDPGEYKILCLFNGCVGKVIVA